MLEPSRAGPCQLEHFEALTNPAQYDVLDVLNIGIRRLYARSSNNMLTIFIHTDTLEVLVHDPEIQRGSNLCYSIK